LYNQIFVIEFLVTLLLFFFQGEDGIRDRNVTGVQTCALPISAAPAVRRRPCSRRETRSGGCSRPAHFFLPVFAAYSKAARGVSVCGMPVMSRREMRLVAQPATTEAFRPKVGIAYTWYARAIAQAGSPRTSTSFSPSCRRHTPLYMPRVAITPRLRW